MAEFHKLYFRVAFVALLTHLAAGSCNDLDLGMASGLIVDSQITSSGDRGLHVPAKNGRLNNAGLPWCASRSDSSPHLQIDLETLHIICAVSTQGNAQEDQWVETYKLQSSTDGTSWIDYPEDGQAEIFSGNVDRNSEVKHLLFEGLLTRYLRFLPLTRYSQDACMRTELFGVKIHPASLARDKVTRQSSTFPSGASDDSSKAVDGNADTDYNNGHCSHTLENNPSWWRVDMGSDYVPVSEVHIVNRIGADPNRNKNYKITLGALSTVASNTQCEGLYSFVNFKASAVCFNNPLMTGRYLGIMTTRRQILQLCEVEIYSRENLAFSKSTSQSSQEEPYGPDGAVDGNTGTNIGSPCTHTLAGSGNSGTSNPWWMVDLGQVEPVSEVYVVNRGGCCGARLNGFEIRVGSDGSNGGVSNPKCGDTYSVPQGQGLSFYCRPSLRGRYVTITIPENNKILTLCEVEVYSERRACQIQAVGLASSDAFPNDRFSASSFRAGNEPFKGRLTGGSVWAPSSNNANDYLQIDLGYDFYICAVATQGDPDNNRWTTKYKLQLSFDSNNWTAYQESSVDKIFDGNSGRHGIVKHNLKGLTSARFMRFLPTAYSGRKVLRVEIYGIEKPRATPSQPPSTFTVNPQSSTSVRASWGLPPLDSIHEPIIGFIVLYKQKISGSAKEQIIIGGNTTLFKYVTGLLIFTEYEFQVLAFTSAGDGKKSSVKTVITNEDAPSEPPTSFVVAAQSSTSVRASWNLPPEGSRNGNIIGFRVYYRLNTSSADPYTQVTINDGSRSDEVIRRLEKYTQYDLMVLAFTSAGNGPNSSVLTETTLQDAPSAPTSLNRVIVTPESSHGPRVTLTWGKPAKKNGIITQYEVLYNGRSEKTEKDVLTYTADVRGGVTYQFEVRALTISPGPVAPISVIIPEYAPSVPLSLVDLIIPPSESHGPMVKLTWSKPAYENGHIRRYDVFYSHNEDSHNVHFESSVASILMYMTEVLGGVELQYRVRAVTIAPGVNASGTLDIPEYAPSVGPENISFAKANETTWNISWVPIPREKSYGRIKVYEVKQEFISGGERQRRSTAQPKEINSTQTHTVVSGLQLCAQYNVSVRGFTGAGPGPYSTPVALVTSMPGAPQGLKATSTKDDHVTLEWEEPIVNVEGGLTYTVEYSGTKDYNTSFTDNGQRNANKSTTYVVTGLVPGSRYKFDIYGTSACGRGQTITLPVIATHNAEPISPAVHNLTETKVDETSAEIVLWPAEQRNGPISAYQVIVLEGNEDLPSDYRSKIKNYREASELNLKFYITAELKNDPARTGPWKFTVGDGMEENDFVNAELQRGKTYTVYLRAITPDNKATAILAGKASKVAKITVNQVGSGDKDETSSGSSVGVVVAVPLVLLILIAIVIAAVFFIRRKRRNGKRDEDNRVPVPLDSLGQESADAGGSRANLVYQNVNDIRAAEEQPQPAQEENLVYSEPEDGSPRAIPVAEFANYYEKKAENGKIKLREEFKAFPGGLQFPWGIGQKNKPKNRYGNIVTYDHSRVVLDKTADDPTSDYINASYIPSFDEEPKAYIATQGPTPKTINDFWRMIWLENCSIIVMLTNLVEVGKAKCEKYWPDRTTKYGAITVTLHKSESFADYEIRTFIAIKGEQRREVVQFHFTSWPDKGVPQHATPLLGFRRKIRSWSTSTDGPPVIHCSAGVGRTGTFIALDTMLESAKKTKSVFIHKFMHEMRGARPYMVQTDDQYVFLHQAVMEVLTCGNTEIPAQDLRIAMNKLAASGKSARKTGYQKEFQRLELISSLLGSHEQTTAAFQPPNINKNRFPNIVPLDTARVILMSSGPGKDYINASFVDDYKKRNAYILTQAPLENTMEDFWQMVSQYNVGTIVMLDGLKEGKESFPQYWPSDGSVKYGGTSVQLLSEDQADNITTRRLKVLSEEPRRKQTTVQHLQYTGWTNSASSSDPQDILDLLTAIQQSQQQTGDEVIVFQCSNGIGRSGTVAAIISIVERAKAEQTIDVFQAIRLIRVKRPGAVETLEQYKFCYETVQAYLDSFSNYANFTR